MIELSDKQKSEFFHRCFTAVDGLWFMKIEEAYGFDTALDIDDAVWKVMPKIQSRVLKQLCSQESGIEALQECWTTKQHLEGFTFDAELDDDGAGFTVRVRQCPWHETMIRSGREQLSGHIGNRICHTECAGWAAEFGDDIEGILKEQICTGSNICRFRFHRRTNSP